MRRLDPVLLRYFIFRGTLSRAYVPILALYMLDQGLSLGQIALITVIGQAASLLFEIPSGAIADTIGHKQTLIIAMLGEAMSSLLFIGGMLPWIATGTLAFFFFNALQSGTSEALFFEYVKSIGRQAEHLKLLGQGKALSWTFNMFTVFIGGATYGWNHVFPFIGAAVIFSIGAIAIAGFPPIKNTESIEKREGFTELFRHFPRAVRTIISHRYVFWLVLLNALLIGSILGSSDFQQIVFNNLGATALFIGVVFAIKRAFSVLLSSYAHHFTRVSPPVMMAIFTFFTCVYMIVTPFISSFLFYGLIVLCSVIVLALLDIIFSDWLNQAIPSLSRATTISVARFVQSGVGILAASLFGWLSFSPEWIFSVLGIALLILSILPLAQLSRTYTQSLKNT